MNTKLITFVILLVSLTTFSSVVTASDSDAAESFTITDTQGHEEIFSEPANKIATLGYGFTVTVVEMDCKDKIAAIDSYSRFEYTKDERMEGLDELNLGSAYSSNKDGILAWMVQLVDNGKFDISKDIIILNNYSGTIAAGGTYDSLKEKGFKVLTYGPNTYDDTIEMIEDFAKILGSDKGRKIASDMKEIVSYIDTELKNAGITEKSRAAYVGYSSSVIKIGNTNSLTADLIIKAGGINSGADAAKSQPSYGVEGSTLLQMKNAGNLDTIFLDGNYGKTASDFCSEVLHTTNIDTFKLEKTWNNYCPDLKDGVWSMACNMYPDVFDGEIPSFDDGDSNIILYAIAGVVIAAIVAVGVICFVKR